MAQSDFNLKIIEEFRANGGETFGPFKGRPLLLLTTTGAKSGEPRTTPLVYTRDANRIVVAHRWVARRGTRHGSSISPRTPR